MIKQICPQCQHGNPLDNHFCGRCGASLDHYQIVPRQETGLTIAGHTLPGEQLKQIGQAAAVSLAALAAEVALAWLRRRVGQMTASPPLQQRQPAARTSQAAIVPARAGNKVTVSGQRVVAIWQRGSLVWQMVERTVWRREE